MGQFQAGCTELPNDIQDEGSVKDNFLCCYIIKVRIIIACVVALAMMSSPVQAQDSIVVGVDPAMYDIVVAGVKGWNEAGLDFVVHPTGCGTGDVTFCYSGDPWSVGGNEAWVAWYVIGSDTIYVSTVSDYSFLPTTVCHELGHWLGLHYHRTDGASCMSDNGQTSASPDRTDLDNLGWP